MRTGLSRATTHHLKAADTIPARVRLGPNSAAWYASDIGIFTADPMGNRA